MICTCHLTAFDHFWDSWVGSDGDGPSMDVHKRHARAAWNEALIQAGRGMHPMLRDMISRGEARRVPEAQSAPFKISIGGEMSDTPRTDALGTNGYLETAVALCRTLERENAALREALADMVRTFDGYQGMELKNAKAALGSEPLKSWRCELCHDTGRIPVGRQLGADDAEFVACDCKGHDSGTSDAERFRAWLLECFESWDLRLRDDSAEKAMARVIQFIKESEIDGRRYTEAPERDSAPAPCYHREECAKGETPPGLGPFRCHECPSLKTGDAPR